MSLADREKNCSDWKCLGRSSRRVIEPLCLFVVLEGTLGMMLRENQREATHSISFFVGGSICVMSFSGTSQHGFWLPFQTHIPCRHKPKLCGYPPDVPNHKLSRLNHTHLKKATPDMCPYAICSVFKGYLHSCRVDWGG